MSLGFARLLKVMVRQGSLAVVIANGPPQLIGDGTTPVATLRITSHKLDRSIAFNPMLRLGEAYMDGGLTVDDGTIYDVLALLGRNLRHLPRNSWAAILGRLTHRIKQHNPLARSRENVAHHYDLSGALYDLFLDADRQYSCAYFRNPADTLDEAQRAKQLHVAAKLLLDRPGLRVLDIGSGWGGLGLYLAQAAEADVTGVTLSAEQHRISTARAEAAGLESRARFVLQDYRTLTGRFDRIVSVGMFEHVGKRNYTEFFARLHDLLTDDGVALLHACGYSDAPAPINPFIRKYIFPGADQPSLSEVFAAVERSGLIVTDLEILRQHYAETLHHWRTRFRAHWTEAAALYDDRFCRMWEFYLALCEVGFRYLSSMVFQMQLTHRADAAPITRDYIAAAEQAARSS